MTQPQNFGVPPTNLDISPHLCKQDDLLSQCRNLMVRLRTRLPPPMQRAVKSQVVV